MDFFFRFFGPSKMNVNFKIANPLEKFATGIMFENLKTSEILMEYLFLLPIHRTMKKRK